MDHQFKPITCPERLVTQLPALVGRVEYLMRRALRAAHSEQGITPGEFLSGMLLMGGTGTPDRVVLRSGIVLNASEDPYDHLDLLTCLKYLCCGGLRILSKDGEKWVYATDQDAFFRFFGIPYHYDTVPQRPCRRMLRAGDFGRSMLRLYRILSADPKDDHSLSSRSDLTAKVKALMGVLQPLCDTPWEHRERCVRLMRILVKAHFVTSDAQAQAIFEEGCRLQQGDGVDRDPEAAVHCYQKAAAAGHPGARLALARCQQLEDGMPWDIPAAVQTYRALADQGYGPAMRSLADCHWKGIGVESDPLEALSLYSQAARTGDPLALEALEELIAKEDSRLSLLAALRRSRRVSDDTT